MNLVILGQILSSRSKILACCMYEPLQVGSNPKVIFLYNTITLDRHLITSTQQFLKTRTAIWTGSLRWYWGIIFMSCLSMLSLQAQDSLGAAAPVPNPLVPRPIARQAAAPVLLPVTDIAKTASLSYFPRKYAVQTSTIERRFYTDNIFDIDESDNPFALSLGKSKKNKRATREPQQQQVSEVLKHLFSAPDADAEQSGQWLIFILIGLLGFLAVRLAVYMKDIRVTLQAFLSTNASKHIQREQAGFFQPESLSGYLLFGGSMGTYIFLTLRILVPDSNFNGFGILLLLMIGVLGVYILKHLQLLLLSLILPCPDELESYNFIISTTNKTLGIILLPLLFLIAYLPTNIQTTALYGSFFLLGVVYVWRTLKGLLSAANLILFRKFHFFVYLCAVEIAPTLILLKLLYVV